MDIKKRNQILSEINKVLDNTFRVIVDCHDLIPEAGIYLSMYNGSETQFILDAKAPLECGLGKCCKLLTFELYSLMRQVFLTIAHYPTPISLQQIQALVRDLETGNNFSDNISPYMIEKAYLCCLIHLGMISYAKSKENKDQIDRLFDANFAFEKGKELDELSGKLYSATFALSNNEIDKTRSLLFPVMHHTKPFVYNGRCSKFTYLHVLQYFNDKIHIPKCVSFKVEYLSYCTDMVFPLYAVYFVPDPIKYELILQKRKPKDLLCCVYHPVVYASYLMFEIARKKNETKQKKNAILDNLSKFIEIYHGPSDLHRAYNLLGFCYYINGEKNNAFAAYCKSIQNKPDDTNVGVYFLCIIVWENINCQSTEVPIRSTFSYLKHMLFVFVCLCFYYLYHVYLGVVERWDWCDLLCSLYCLVGFLNIACHIIKHND